MTVEVIDEHKLGGSSQHSETTSHKEAGHVSIVALESDLKGDEGLHELGYKAELHRTRGFKELLAMSITCLAIPYGYGTTLYTGEGALFG